MLHLAVRLWPGSVVFAVMVKLHSPPTDGNQPKWRDCEVPFMMATPWHIFINILDWPNYHEKSINQVETQLL